MHRTRQHLRRAKVDNLSPFRLSLLGFQLIVFLPDFLRPLEVKGASRSVAKVSKKGSPSKSAKKTKSKATPRNARSERKATNPREARSSREARTLAPTKKPTAKAVEAATEKKLKAPPPKAPSIKGEKKVTPSPRTEPIRLVPAKPSKNPPPRPVVSNEDVVEKKKKKLPINNPPVPPAPVMSDSKPKKNQAGLTSRELDHFRDLLLAKRRELVGDMSSMEREALRSASGTNLSNLPLHMADMGTDNYEQEFTLGIVEKDRGLVREINQALAKIQNGTYGICEGTAKPIAKPRLEAQPWAKFSIEHARAMEKRRMQF
jgi:DnaK suppressor protein